MGIAYNTSIVRNGLVLYLDAANIKSYPGTGTVWNDLSGNGNNGTLLNGTGYTTDNNGALVFDGLNDSSNHGNPSSLNITTENFTLSAWFNINSFVSGWTSIFQKGTSGNIGYGMHLNGNILNASIQAAGGFNQHVSLGTAVPTNTWINACLVFNRASNVVGYINGTSVGSDSIASNAGSLATASNLVIGAYPSSWWFPGKISSASIYNRALSSNEIQQNFNAMRGRYNV